MPYPVRSDHIAEDIDEDVRREILSFLQTYQFRYVTTVMNRGDLISRFTDYFTNRRTLDWLVWQIAPIVSRQSNGTRIATSESNRLHTWGLGRVLLNRGEHECTTIHTANSGTPMCQACVANLDGRRLNIDAIIRNTFPATAVELNRGDIPMVPQHPNCGHVLAPIE
jgi:hypothetical protein